LSAGIVVYGAGIAQYVSGPNARGVIVDGPGIAGDSGAISAIIVVYAGKVGRTRAVHSGEHSRRRHAEQQE
jgi:hypothetical protein